MIKPSRQSTTRRLVIAGTLFLQLSTVSAVPANAAEWGGVSRFFASRLNGAKTAVVDRCRDLYDRLNPQAQSQKSELSWEEKVKAIPYRDTSERNPNFLDDFEYLKEKRYLGQMGRVTSEYDTRFQTRVYYPANAKPDASGHITRTNKDARATFIYFHGSGTDKSSGANFAYKQNQLAELGYHSIGFDFPFHRDGPIDPKLLKSDEFMTWLHEFIEAHRVEGQPLFLVGHSFGPDLIAEYLKRYPHGVDGASLMSPAGFNQELDDWYNTATVKMQAFWKESGTNDAGAEWAGQVSSDFTWKKQPTSRSPDPTVANPKLKVRVLSGELEEYVPGPLDENGMPKGPRTYDFCAAFRKLMAHIECTVEKGVGHLIFFHKDEKGHDLILRELLALDGESLDNQAALKAAANARIPSDVEGVAQRYAKEPFFRGWMDQRFGKDKIPQMLAANDSKGAQLINRDFKQIVTQREKAVAENIKRMKELAPDFYAANQADIDQLGPQNMDRVVGKYFDYIEGASPQLRNQLVATQDVYKLPERSSGPPPEWVMRPKKEKPPKKSGGAPLEGTAARVLENSIPPTDGTPSSVNPANAVPSDSSPANATPDEAPQLDGDRGPASMLYTPMPRWFSVPMIDRGV